MTALPATADVVIVGGGVNGAAIALQLAKAGSGSVVVLEATTVAHGASSRGPGILRTYYADLDESRLAIDSLTTFRNWADEIGGDCGYVPTGFLWIVGPGEEAALRANVVRLRDAGARIEFLSPAELAAMQPHLSSDDIGGAAWEPLGGYAEPRKSTLALRDAATRAGTRFFEAKPVTGLIVEAGQVRGVRLRAGVIETRNVVVAAGAWSANLLGQVGLEIPVAAMRMTVGTVRHAPLPVPPATFIDTHRDVYLRPTADPQVSFVSIRDDHHDTRVDPEGFNFEQNVPVEAARSAITRLRVRIPGLDARPDRQWAAIDGVTPDRKGIYGSTPVDGLFLCIGSSYKGFKVAPAVGRLVAGVVRREACDMPAFALARFAGRPVSPDATPYTLQGIE